MSSRDTDILLVHMMEMLYGKTKEHPIFKTWGMIFESGYEKRIEQQESGACGKFSRDTEAICQQNKAFIKHWLFLALS